MKRKIYIALSLILLVLFFSGITYSLFHSNTSLNSSNQGLANFVFNAENLDSISLNLEDLTPGTTLEYEFSVTNKELEKISDVTIEYELKIKTYHFIPLNIELYKITDKEEKVGNCEDDYERDSNNQLVCNMPIEQMDKNVNTTDNYKIVISFPSEYSGIEYSNLVDFIDIEIDSWQKI